MFKKTSENSQNRIHRNAEHSRKNTGGIEPSTFDDNQLIVRDRILGEQVAQIEIKLGRIKTLIEEADLRKGTFGSRSVGPAIMARWVHEKRMLLGELNAARTERMKFHREVLQRTAKGRKIENETFDAIFHALAKEMLAGPVYNRVATATIHRIHEQEEK